MDKTTKENKQTIQKSSVEEQTNDEKTIPEWITTKNKIDDNSTDIVNKVLLRILEKAKKYYDDDSFRILLRRLHVNDMSMGNYEPMVVRIGLNKWDTAEADVMESHKLRYTYNFFERTDINLEQFLRANFSAIIVSIMESKLTNNRSNLDDDVLMEMLILDGCFIIELFLKNNDSKKKHSDVLFSSKLLLMALCRDLLLLDNQLPFLVLQILFEKSGLMEKLGQHDGYHPDLIELAFKFLKRILPTKKLDKTLVSDTPTDLQSVVYEGLSWLRLEANNNSNSNNDHDEEDRDDKWDLVKSATELHEFGVEFKMVDTENFIDIKFTKEGVLEIPRILIRYGTAYSINMLLQVENNFFYNINNLDEQKWLSDYLWFMNSLVKSPSDVQLLCHEKIIDNLSELPDDAAIHKFLKDLYASLMISPANFNYIQVCKDLNSHCKRRQNYWMAILKRDYFSSPSTIISFYAASLLLVLTIVQTVFSVASYYKDQGGSRRGG
ncbi:UPF0481 protein At3g47200-like isoform X2 [Diospyros lotus]|nr:UPF0481 protein At3g47200-like isoform X2 [Diospyros lotus]XP_052207080.1 UPF0481 protein At3g47200-like isoform X2 [Diospyros lotus]